MGEPPGPNLSKGPQPICDATEDKLHQPLPSGQARGPDDSTAMTSSISIS